jgi:hypothetical protein
VRLSYRVGSIVARKKLGHPFFAASLIFVVVVDGGKHDKVTSFVNVVGAARQI